ncbi:MAG: peptidase M28 family protein, partial [Sphingomonas bacterium]|nr:peptidase M28 family protein [Sphingomonas bacterium]
MTAGSALARQADMIRPLFAATLLATAATLPAQVSPREVDQLRDSALTDSYAWDITEGLTTEVGQRMAGTEAEARARAWSVAKLKAMGFANVRIDPFTIPVWVRGAESALILAPFPQKLVIAALGNSGSTPAGGIEGELVGFDTLAELEAAPDATVRGKIVFVSHAMPRTEDGSSYGVFGAARRQGPSIASRKGAIAIVIRSIGTDYHRNPHTGTMSFADGVKPIPAGALPLPDA